MREAHRMRRESTATRETPAGSARKPRRPGPAHLDSRRACRTCPAVMGLIAFGAAGKLLAADIDTSRLPPPASVQIEFTRDIKPILADHCYKCHSGEQPRSHFLLTSRESALKGGNENSDDIVPGDSRRSKLILYVAQLVEDIPAWRPERRARRAIARAAGPCCRAWRAGRPAASRRAGRRGPLP